VPRSPLVSSSFVTKGIVVVRGGRWLKTHHIGGLAAAGETTINCTLEPPN
jgi:hypothetical protein